MKITYSYFGVQLSKNVKKSKLSKLYQSCYGHDTEAEWMFAGGERGPFLDDVSDEGIEGQLFGNAHQIMVEIDRNASSDGQEACAIVDEYL